MEQGEADSRFGTVHQVRLVPFPDTAVDEGPTLTGSLRSNVLAASMMA